MHRRQLTAMYPVGNSLFAVRILIRHSRIVKCGSWTGTKIFANESIMLQRTRETRRLLVT